MFPLNKLNLPPLNGSTVAVSSVKALTLYNTLYHYVKFHNKHETIPYIVSIGEN